MICPASSQSAITTLLAPVCVGSVVGVVSEEVVSVGWADCVASLVWELEELAVLAVVASVVVVTAASLVEVVVSLGSSRGMSVTITESR